MVCGDATCATAAAWVAGCLSLVGMDFKFTHSHAFILGVVWSALDIVGDVLFSWGFIVNADSFGSQRRMI